MATGTVSAIDREEWRLIESKAATGTSVTFDNFSGYKHLWVTGISITKSASTQISFRPNNNSTAGYYFNAYDAGRDNRFLAVGASSTAAALSFKIFDVDKTTPKHVATSHDASLPSNEMDAFVDTVPVTSLVLFTQNGTATFTGGTFYLYGIVA